MRNGFLTLAVVVGLCAGCMTRPDDVPAASTQPAKAAGQRPYRWVQTMGPGATWVVITELTIPGIFTDERREITIEPRALYDEQGMPVLPSSCFSFECVDGIGREGRFSYNGAVNVDRFEGSEDSVIFDVYYSWRISKQAKGVLDRKVPVQLGVPADIDLPEGAHLRVRWREIKETVKP